MPKIGVTRANVRWFLLAALALALVLLPGRVARAQDPTPDEADATPHEATIPNAETPPAESSHHAEPAAPNAGHHDDPARHDDGAHAAPAHAEHDGVVHSPEEEAAMEAREDDTGELEVPDAIEGALKEQFETAKDPAILATLIRKGVELAREKVLPKLEEKMVAKHNTKMNRLTIALGVVSLGGLLLLFTPIFLAKKYPGKLGILFKFSAIAAFSAVLTLALFAGVVLMIKTVQGVASHSTNPQLVIIEKSLDTLDDEAEDFVESAKGVIEPSLNELGREDGDLPAVLLDNAQRLVKDAGPFISAAKLMKGISFIFAYIPVVTTAIAILLFLLGARPILKELMAMPGRAASGADTKGVVSKAFKYVGEELVAALGLILMVVVTTFLALEALDAALGPLVHDLLDYTFDNVTYAQTPDASTGIIFSSLILTGLSLGISVVLLIVSGVLYLGKVHKILQARVHEKVPLGAHKKFWIWGTVAFVFAQAYPYLFAAATRPLIDKITSHAAAGETPSYALILLSGPLVMVVGWLLVFWAVRGLKGLVYIVKYKPLAPAAPVAKPLAA